MSTVKVFARRDSATAALRKLGIARDQYARFITNGPGAAVTCDLKAAQQSLVRVSETRSQSSTRSTVSSTTRALIRAGKTNAEVWEIIKSQFNLDDSKRHYPSWYRSEMKRTARA